ncbi:MAG: TAXI family TRAP transporter solute-binding subunit [Clostridiales bacterium]|nr:TAXI family TRAP transporter solute-binding subunit [Clostridiales bacterium]
MYTQIQKSRRFSLMKKRILALAMALILLVGITATASAATFISIATGGTSGTYYPLGGDIANLFNTVIKDVKASAQATGGSADNLRLMQAGDAEMGTVQNDVAIFAYTGTDSFENEQITGFSVVSSLYAEYVQIVVRADSDIQCISDLKGKVVSIGAAGSGVYTNAMHVLEAAGLTVDDIDAQYLSFAESGDGLKNKQIDAAFICAGIPNAAITELASTTGVRLVPLSDEEVNKLITAHPTYANLKLPADVYGLDADVNSIAITALLVCTDTLDDDLVYEMTKALFEQEGILTHAKAAEITLDTAFAGVGELPFHPGAVRYYQEVNLMDADGNIIK